MIGSVENGAIKKKGKTMECTEQFELSGGVCNLPTVKTKGIISAIVAMVVLGVVCNVTVVLLFLNFIDNQSQHVDRVDDLRIKTCHDISLRGAEAMEKVSSALILQTEEFRQFSHVLEDIHISVNKNRDSFERLIEIENARLEQERRK